MKRLYNTIAVFLFITIPVNAQIFFEDQATAIGLNFSCGYTFLGNGVSFVDFDNDGWDDLTFTTEINEPIQFFRNNNGVFVPQAFNFSDPNYQYKQVNWVDIDNDGDKDLFATSNLNGNRLYENIGSFNLIDITVASGMPLTNFGSYGASWGDYDNDGFLDVFICNRDGGEEIPNYLFKNNGNKTFTNVSITAGISNENQVSFCSAFFDFNNDGWQDIYVSNDRFENTNVLYKNNGDGTFSDVSMSSKTNISADAMTVTVGDINNDGWFDIYVTNSPDGNYLLENQGNETFIDITSDSGTLFNSWGWGAVFLDAENDMDLDLYVSGQLDGSDPDLISAAFFENIGNNVFIEPDTDGFLGDNSTSFSNAIGDIDNDGLVDIVVTNLDENVFVWKNESVTSFSWLKLKLQGTISNRDGIGSVIEISTNGNKQFRTTLCGEGYLSQNSNTQFFGLGNSSVVDYIKITWLSGIVEYFYNISTNQVFEIIEGTGTLHVPLENDLTLSYYPNPAKEVLYLKNSTHFHFYEIYNMTGQKIVDKKALGQDNLIRFSTLQQGVYFVRLIGDNQIVNLKIVKP